MTSTTLVGCGSEDFEADTNDFVNGVNTVDKLLKKQRQLKATGPSSGMSGGGGGGEGGAETEGQGLEIAVPDSVFLTITASNKLYPKAINVKTGASVNIEFKTESARTDLIFEGFGSTHMVNPGESATLRFTPTEPGVYAFYNGEKTMKGTMIVSDQ